MTYLCRNIHSARQLKFWSDVMISLPLEDYINDLADVHSIHSDSRIFVIVNSVNSKASTHF